MSPMAANHNGDFQLEAGLMSTQEHEKVPFITPGSNHVKSKSVICPSEALEPSKKMSPFRRVSLILTISLIVGLGLALARNPSLSSSCLGWGRGPYQGPFSIARTALNKRQEGSLTNATTARSSIDQGKTPTNPEQTTPPAVVSPSSPPLPATPTPVNPASSSSPAPQATPTSASTTPQRPPPPPSPSTTSTTTAQAPPPPPAVSTTPNQIETSTPPRNPESS
ncbi:hypothetical protein E4U54_008237, partial [Claviceps lovelessii]